MINLLMKIVNLLRFKVMHFLTVVLIKVFLFILLLTVSWVSNAESTEKPVSDLFDMSIEDLMNVEITSVSKRTQKISEAAASVFVISQEDIRRSGVTSIPEALRMVPGLQVAKIDANKWAITSRGFNGFFANKLLVLIDGRSVYTPLFSGVFWDVQDYPLQDVDRIEVIRGPGATMWGANAVNGVINIMTKKTKDTQGTIVEAGFGSEERAFGTIRHGGHSKEDLSYRFYVKYLNRDEGVYGPGNDAHDDWRVLRGGFRMDYEPQNNDFITLQGDIYNGDVGETAIVATPPPDFIRAVTDDVKISGGNLLFRWGRAFSETSEMTFQTYYDRTERDDPMIAEDRDTIDMDIQHQFLLSTCHSLVWGLGYRYTRDDIENTFTLTYDPESRHDDLISGFFQDEILIGDYQMRLTLGSKFEYNDYTGLEIQPNVRLLYNPHQKHSIWISVSRAVRTPSRSEHDVRINLQVLPGTPVVFVSTFGDNDFDSEELLAFELGYRMMANDFLSLDFTTFYNDYDNLRTLEPGPIYLETTPSPTHLVLPLYILNMMEGYTYGAELAADWRYSDRFSLKLAYSYLRIQLRLDSDSNDSSSETAKDDSPHHQYSLRSSVNITSDLELDLWVRYVDKLSSQDIDSYTSLDARLAWRPRKNLEFTIVGQNLIDSQHPEFDQDTFLDVAASEVQRSIYGKITWGF